MRKKGKKVIRPAGDELMDYLNRGFAICNRCGAVMDRREDPRGGCDIYACPSCGWEIDEMEYEYESGDPMELVQDEEAMTTWSSGTTCRPPGAERAEAHTPTASRRAECSTTKHDQRRGGAL